MNSTTIKAVHYQNTDGTSVFLVDEPVEINGLKYKVFETIICDTSHLGHFQECFITVGWFGTVMRVW